MSKETIIIINYGAGNIRSAAKAFEHVIISENLNAHVKVSADPDEIASASRLILPGQGAFGDCITALRASGLIEPLEQAVLKNRKPFLGICVGMQLLVTEGLEHGHHAGLNWLPGRVVPITPADPSIKIPHMGWNTVALTPSSHPVLRSTKKAQDSGEDYYFVHSFMVESEDTDHILATTHHGADIVAAIGRDNILGVQFHPEKSQNAGLGLIKNFLRWTP